MIHTISTMFPLNAVIPRARYEVPTIVIINVGTLNLAVGNGLECLFHKHTMCVFSAATIPFHIRLSFVPTMVIRVMSNTRKLNWPHVDLLMCRSMWISCCQSCFRLCKLPVRSFVHSFHSSTCWKFKNEKKNSYTYTRTPYWPQLYGYHISIWKKFQKFLHSSVGKCRQLIKIKITNDFRLSFSAPFSSY